MALADDGLLHIEVLYCPGPGRCDASVLRLPPGACVADALAASGVVQRHALALGDLQVGVWGRRCDETASLRDRDRVEIYRPLTVDPKEARRLRYKRARQGAPRTAANPSR
jgi:putative ubiquitin-RnfH superfamily antitoxin RatB of RatAB toxin-antitoxin module